MRAVLLGLALCVAFVGCDNRTRSTPPPPTAMAPLDLNRATEKQLEALPSVGPKHAHSILASRNARGGQFRSVDELLEIDGIGPKTVDAIRPYVFVSP
jgi:competence protein ComEA